MGEAVESFDRSSTITVVRGLHVVRYVSFQGQGAPAQARVVASAPEVTLLEMPGRADGVLQKPGECLVLRASQDAEIIVGLRKSGPEGGLDATFRVEPIVREAAPQRPREDVTSVSFLAHLSNRGDVKFAQGVWAGGPDSPAAVEGLEIVQSSGASLLEMQVLVASRPPRWSEWVGAGQFVGTRGYGLPISGLRFRTAPQSEVEILAEAHFLGSLVATRRGKQVEFMSASGIDPLVGVKIGLLNGQAGGASGTVSDAPLQDREPRVRVFRASSAR